MAFGQHNDFPATAPADLRQGDIVRSYISTTLPGGAVTQAPRNAMVLGMEYDPEDQAVKGLYLVRFSYNDGKFEPAYEWDAAEAQRQSIVQGLHRPAILRTNRVDLLTLNQDNFGERVKVIGTVAPAAFPEIAARLDLGLKHQDAEPSRGDRTKEPHTNVIPSLKNTNAAFAFPGVPALGKPEVGVKEDVWDMALRQVAERRRAAVAQIDQGLAPVMPSAHQTDLGYTPTPDAAWKGVQRRTAPARQSEATPIEMLKAPVQKENKPVPVAPPKRHLPVPAPKPYIARPYGGEPAYILADKLMEAFAAKTSGDNSAATPHKPAHTLVRAMEKQTPLADKLAKKAQPKPYFDSTRDYRPVLPNNLRRGDIVIARLTDLLQPERDQAAKRPCVVMDVYEDESGTVVGLDLLACTRSRARFFTHKIEMPSVFKRDRWDGTHLILEKLARLPVTSQHFYERVDRAGFLNPALLEEAATRYADLLETGRTQTPYGLETVPDTWRKRDIEQRPVTDASRRFAAAVHAHAGRERPLPQVTPGDIILRRSLNDKGDLYPALVWGVWRHDSTNGIAAVELARINTNPRNKNEDWHQDLDAGLMPGIIPPDGDARIEMQAIDLVPNENYFLQDTAIIGHVAQNDMDALVNRRDKALRHCKARDARAPQFLPFNWRRTEGVSYDLNNRQVARATFAPDLALHRSPGKISTERMRTIHLERLDLK